jgi:hypothetical protein
MFLSPGRGGGRVEMERHGEQQPIHSSQIEGDKQAAAGQFVFLGRSEGMFREEQAGESSSVQSGLEALASCEIPVEKRDSGRFVSLELGEGNLGDDVACREFYVDVPSAVRSSR